MLEVCVFHMLNGTLVSSFKTERFNLGIFLELLGLVL